MKRAPGFYWVRQAHSSSPIVAYWTGKEWLGRLKTIRITKVLSGRLTPPEKGWIPLPVDRVLLDTGKGYREELTVDRVNHATGAVFVSRRAKS